MASWGGGSLLQGGKQTVTSTGLDSPGSPLAQSMENLYGQGTEGTPPSTEDCDAGESLSCTQAGQRVLGRWTEGQRTGAEGGEGLSPG